MKGTEFEKLTSHLSERRLIELGVFIEAYCLNQWALHEKDIFQRFHDFKEHKVKQVCSFTVGCKEKVHDCKYVEACNHCEGHCWNGPM